MFGILLILIRVLTPFFFWSASDFPKNRAAVQLVGKLYGLCTKSSIKTQGAIDLFDKDAIAYAKWVRVCILGFLLVGRLRWCLTDNLLSRFIKKGVQRFYGCSEAWRKDLPSWTSTRESTRVSSASINITIGKIFLGWRWCSSSIRSSCARSWRYHDGIIYHHSTIQCVSITLIKSVLHCWSPPPYNLVVSDLK